MVPRIISIIAIGACSQQSTWSGYEEGNAAPTGVILAEGSGVSPTLATITIKDLYFAECAGEINAANINLELDLLYADEMTIPYGDWCLIEFTTDDPITLAGDTDAGGTWQLELSLGSVRLESETAVSIDGSPLVMQLGQTGWLDSNAIGSASSDVLIDESHALHDVLAEQLADGSQLYRDDGDGVLSDEEESVGPIITGSLQ